LGAGTGCRWCVPFLTHLHRQHTRGETPDLATSPEEYARSRLTFHETDERDPDLLRRVLKDDPATGATLPPPPAPPAPPQPLP
ncbi:MAG: hypothetical protein ACT4PL_00095, partial [Phycisphaerales bacterium]